MSNASHPELLRLIEEFLERSGMGTQYFGKASCGNSEVVGRLRQGRRVWPETEAKIRAFIDSRTAEEAEGSDAPQEDAA